MLCTKLTISAVKIKNVKKLNYILPHKRLTTLNSSLPLKINSQLLSRFLNQFSFQLILCPVDNIMFADQLQYRQTCLLFFAASAVYQPNSRQPAKLCLKDQILLFVQSLPESAGPETSPPRGRVLHHTDWKLRNDYR